MLDHLELNGTEVVLDAGCGTGRVTELLIDRLPDGRVVALDASPSMLEHAKRRLHPWRDRVRFIQADLLDLDRRNLGEEAPLDAVFSTATFHWVRDHDRLFANLAAVLRPGGQLVAQCGAKGNIDRVVRAALSIGFEQVQAWHFASADETVGRLRGCGFTGVRVWTHPEPTSFPTNDALIDFLETACLDRTWPASRPDGAAPWPGRSPHPWTSRSSTTSDSTSWVAGPSREASPACDLRRGRGGTAPGRRAPSPCERSWWRRPDSNRRPAGCKPAALPTELRPHGRQKSR